MHAWLLAIAIIPIQNEKKKWKVQGTDTVILITRYTALEGVLRGMYIRPENIIPAQRWRLGKRLRAAPRYQ